MRARHCCLILPINDFYSPETGGATATITAKYAQEFLSRGSRVTILARTCEKKVYPVGDVKTIEGRERHELSIWQRLISKVRRPFSTDDIAFYEWYEASLCDQLKKLSPAPDVILLHNDCVAPRHAKRIVPTAKIVLCLQNEQRTRSRNVAALVKSVDQFVACSRYIAAWTLNRYPIKPERMTVINNGVDLAAFSPRPDFLEPRNVLRVLFVGRIDPNKGPDLVADAVAAARAEGVAIELQVAGGLWFHGHGQEMANPYFRALKSKMDAASAKYLGHVVREELPEVIRQADVVCVLSRSNDPNPLVCLEAMASGCVVVGANRGGIPDTCTDAGILVDPDDRAAIKTAIVRLGTEPSFLRQEKLRSVARAAKCSWSARISEMEPLL